MVSAHPSPLSLRIYQAKKVYTMYILYIYLCNQNSRQKGIYYVYTIYIPSIYLWLVLDMGKNIVFEA